MNIVLTVHQFLDLTQALSIDESFHDAGLTRFLRNQYASSSVKYSTNYEKYCVINFTTRSEYTHFCLTYL